LRFVVQAVVETHASTAQHLGAASRRILRVHPVPDVGCADEAGFAAEEGFQASLVPTFE
jgi:hypothetical protein